MKLDVYTLVFLRRPAHPPEMSEDELEALQVEHLAFNERMREAGHAVVYGPLAGQRDESFRGISVFRTSVEQTRALVDQDPSVVAGRLEVEVCSWFMRPGALGDRPTAMVEID
jgi:uncharacterized protein